MALPGSPSRLNFSVSPASKQGPRSAARRCQHRCCCDSLPRCRRPASQQGPRSFFQLSLPP
eukprot:5120134-Heterocapsa_arctica.AAC.1